MQDMTVSACQDAEIGVTKQLIDRRDTKSYWVAKLDDGNCWMTQNLALNLNGKTLTTSDSDVSANWSGASGVSSALWGDTGANVIKWYASGTGSGRASYGNHYSWEAATAGTGSKVTTNGANASNSICPKNWKLPTKDQFVTLAGGLNPVTIQAAPYYFVFGGYVNSGSLTNAGERGYYWSSTANNSTTSAYVLSFHSGSVNPSSNYNRYIGMSVRCLVQGS